LNGQRVKPFTESKEVEFDPEEVEQIAGQALGPIKTVDNRGVERWHFQGKLHREDGPALIYPESLGGAQWWYKRGTIHRTNGPAIIYPNGTSVWFNNGREHRVGGPAVEYASGTKIWKQNGAYHRLDGPAVERPRSKTYKWYQWGKLHRTDGPASDSWKQGFHIQKWYINGRKVTPYYAQIWGNKGGRAPRKTGLVARDWNATEDWMPENALALVANYLYEGRVEAAKKKYPGIPKKVWDVFTGKDPSGGRQKYLDWIAKNYVITPEEDRPAPDDIMAWVKKLYQRKEDINSLGSLGDLEQKITGEAMGGKRAQIMKGAYTLQDDADWLIVSPSTWAASRFYGGSTKWCVATGNIAYWYDHAKQGELIYFKNRHLAQGDRLWKVAAYWSESGNDSREDIHDWNWYNTFDQQMDDEDIDEIWEAISPAAQKAILEMIENSDPYNYDGNLESEVAEEHWENEDGRTKTIHGLIDIVDERGNLTEDEFLRQLAQVTENPESFLRTVHWIGFYDSNEQFKPDDWGLPEYEGLEHYYRDRGDGQSEEMGIIDELIALNHSGEPMFNIIRDALDYWQWNDLIRYWGEENLRTRLKDAVITMQWKRGAEAGDTATLDVYNYEQVLDVLRSTDPVLHEYLVRLSTTHESAPTAIVSRLMN
jgi:hypothetical protein